MDEARKVAFNRRGDVVGVKAKGDLRWLFQSRSKVGHDGARIKELEIGINREPLRDFREGLTKLDDVTLDTI